MWLDLTEFVLLALLCNTIFPIPFDPVLIYFASRHAGMDAVVFAIVGGICAGLSGAGEAKALGVLNSYATHSRLRALLPHWYGFRFYVLTFLFALLPLPFSMVRLAVLQYRPRVVSYAVAIVFGRLPRYLLTIVLWRGLGFPSWVNAGILLSAAAFAALKSVLVCRKNASRALEVRRADLSCRARAGAGEPWRLSGLRLSG